MTKQFDAIYEDGVLRPLEPLVLPDRERVRVTISQAGDEDWMDVEFMDSCADDSDPSIPIEHIRTAMSKIQGTMAEAMNETRGEF